jgi:hypothetical protein
MHRGCPQNSLRQVSPTKTNETTLTTCTGSYKTNPQQRKRESPTLLTERQQTRRTVDPRPHASPTPVIAPSSAFSWSRTHSHTFRAGESNEGLSSATHAWRLATPDTVDTLPSPWDSTAESLFAPESELSQISPLLHFSP